MGFGVPLTGLIADQISSAFGRPMEINMGPSVFGGDTAPETGVVGDQTYSGPGMTVRDNSDKGTYYGVSPTMGSFAQGASAAMPHSATYMGADPTPVDAEPTDGFTPTTPNPSPIDTAPNNIQVAAGNTNLSADEISRLFLGFMTPGRTARGRNSGRVIV